MICAGNTYFQFIKIFLFLFWLYVGLTPENIVNAAFLALLYEENDELIQSRDSPGFPLNNYPHSILCFHEYLSQLLLELHQVVIRAWFKSISTRNSELFCLIITRCLLINCQSFLISGKTFLTWNLHQRYLMEFPMIISDYFFQSLKQ